MGGTSWPVQGSPLRYGENYTLDQRDTGSLSSSHCLSTPRHLAHLVGIIHLVGLVLIDLLVHLGNFVLHVLNILKDVDVKNEIYEKIDNCSGKRAATFSHFSFSFMFLGP